jgi:serine/threonine protein phosphatase PrpC
MTPDPSPEKEPEASSVFKPVTSSDLAEFNAQPDQDAEPLLGETAETLPLEPDSTEPEVNEVIAFTPGITEPTPAPEIPEPNPALILSFSPPPDVPFQSSLTLGLSCPSPTAKIHYALGAANVDDEGIPYEAKDKILLTQSTLVSARAYENGECGPVLSGKFEIKKPLWQELEPADQTDATPHKLGDNGVTVDGWKVSAGSVRGKLHAHRALWREDSFGFSTAPHGDGLWQILAVSDGAGSAPLSRVGSKIACDTVIAALENSLGELSPFSMERDELAKNDLPALRAALTLAASAALEAIRVEAESRGKPLSAFAATLLVLVRREWNGSQLFASIQVGDGAIALRDEASLTILGVADHGQHSSETRFLTTGGIEAEFASRVQFSIKSNASVFALMSDGVSDDYFPGDKRLGEVLDAVLPTLQSADDGGSALVSWLGYEKKGSSDDRTLLVGWKEAAPLEALAPTESVEPPLTEAPDGDSDRDAR